MLKKQGSSFDDYLCRVRPTHEWENRSVSCEIDLEPGRYEILPKITATRCKDAKTIQQLVEYFADRNPQKLRQVGMQYDLAHAKGGVPDEDLRIETWKAERKRREAQRKREERAAAEKERLAKAVDTVLPLSPAPTPTADLEGKTPVQEGELDDFQDAAETLDEVEDGKRVVNVNGLKKRITFQSKPQIIVPIYATDGDVGPEEVEPGHERQTAEAKETRDDSESAPEQAEKDKKKDKGDEKEDEEKHKHEKRHKGHHPDTDSEEGSSESESDDDEDRHKRWNAVCVVCLRVYSKDPKLSISLVRPGLAEETSSLVQGGEPAGATM